MNSDSYGVKRHSEQDVGVERESACLGPELNQSTNDIWIPTETTNRFNRSFRSFPSPQVLFWGKPIFLSSSMFAFEVSAVQPRKENYKRGVENTNRNRFLEADFTYSPFFASLFSFYFSHARRTALVEKAVQSIAGLNKKKSLRKLCLFNKAEHTERGDGARWKAEKISLKWTPPNKRRRRCEKGAVLHLEFMPDWMIYVRRTRKFSQICADSDRAAGI